MNKKILLVIMDGIGISEKESTNLLQTANTPVLDYLFKNYSHTQLQAHGTAVGLPSNDDMGNSEVGHNTLGCGQIYAQGAKLVNTSIETGVLYEGLTWKKLLENCILNHSTLHFIGLLSDGNVHSHLSHLISMLYKAKEFGVSRVRIHILLDGRDVPSTSALKYVELLENRLTSLNDDTFDSKIASGGGRMTLTMDRYESDWNMVKLGWDTHVKGIGKQFNSTKLAINYYRSKYQVLDQYLPPFVIAQDDEPVGKILEKDSVILFNFRGDRAIELCKAFEDEYFPYFDRGQKLNIEFAGMLQYDGDLNIPHQFLVSPPQIKHTLSELLITNHLTQYAISETQKFGHVTYFWNGNRSEKFNSSLETFAEIPSDNLPFDQRPWMKSAEITDALILAIKSGCYDFMRCNFPNGDMVGHTGNIDATILAIESVDLALSRLIPVCNQYGITLIITSDHGNIDEMYEPNSTQIKTSHSLNKVPFIIYDSTIQYKLKPGSYGLSNVAPTIATLFNLETPTSWNESMI